MTKSGYLAFDLGASSGRALLGTIAGEKLRFREISRFNTGMISINNSWHWNIFRFFEEIKGGILKSMSSEDCSPSSMGINTWGVDFGLLSKEGDLLGLPFAYRDSRTDGMMEKFFNLMPPDELYQLTGNQLIQINSLFQLFSMRYNNHSLLKTATDLLFIPDILNFLLTGEKTTEFSYATTSQLYNPIKGNWESKIFDKLELPIGIMQNIIHHGTKIGTLNRRIVGDIGSLDLDVYAILSHDTGSAVAAIPAKGKDWAFISSGTWSLLGVESPTPIISTLSASLNFTNEGGINSSYRVLKNLTGLWILQKLKMSIKKLHNLSYGEIVENAFKSTAFDAFIDTDNEIFMNPPDMKEAIDQYCQQTGQQNPETAFSYVRCVLEGLALKYRHTLEQLSKIYIHNIERIHIIGGGSKNEMLNQFTANATGKLVLAGPVEATGIGNILVQAMACGVIKSLVEGRKIIERSFPIKTYYPREVNHWDQAYEKYREVLELD